MSKGHDYTTFLNPGDTVHLTHTTNGVKDFEVTHTVDQHQSLNSVYEPHEDSTFKWTIETVIL